MLDILARSFLTASRVDVPGPTEGAKPKPTAKPRWAAPEHWRQRPNMSGDQDRQ